MSRNNDGSIIALTRSQAEIAATAILMLPRYTEPDRQNEREALYVQLQTALRGARAEQGAVG